MKLLVHRSHRPGLFHKAIYTLDFRAQLSDEEYATIAAHGMESTRLYQRMEMTDRGRGLLGLLYQFVFGAADLTLRVRDLIVGKRIETASLVEALSIEDQVSEAARIFNQLVSAASSFDGDHLVEL